MYSNRDVLDLRDLNRTLQFDTGEREIFFRKNLPSYVQIVIGNTHENHKNYTCNFSNVCRHRSIVLDHIAQPIHENVCIYYMYRVFGVSYDALTINAITFVLFTILTYIVFNQYYRTAQ